MKTLFTLLFTLLPAVGLQAQDFESAASAVKNMGVGWNLGNTLDANGNGVQQGLESETSWGQPKTKPELMKMMKEGGFGAIRVPVTWYNHMDADGKVTAEWMARVKEVVDYVIDNGMYCILNVHHDTGDGSTHWLHASMNYYNNTKTKYEYLWSQIGETFKGYDQHLLFEAYNEMLDEYNSWCFASFKADGQYNATSAADSYKAINSYAQSFVNTVRATGGNNQQRNLVINTYGACNGSGNWNAHLKEPLTQLTIPTDPAGTGHIAVQVHSYPNIANLESAKSEVNLMFADLNTYFISKGLPVIIGEWGTSNVDADVTDYEADREKYLNFASYFVTKAKQYNAGTFYWMGISDGSFRVEPLFSQPDLAKAIVGAYHGSTEGFVYPEAGNVSSLTCFDDSKVLGWGDGVKIDAAKFSMIGPSAQLVLTYQQTKDSGDDIQFFLGDWSAKVPSMVDGNSFDGDFGPSGFYDSGAGSTHTTTFAFSESNGQMLASKGLIIHGDGITLKKAVLKNPSASAVQPLRADAGTPSPVYNLSGQRVTVPRKGVYIVNGCKVVMK